MMGEVVPPPPLMLRPLQADQGHPRIEDEAFVLDLDEGGFSCREDVVGGFIASGLAVEEAFDSPLGVLRVLRVLDLGSLPNEDTIGEQSGGVEAEGIDSTVGFLPPPEEGTADMEYFEVPNVVGLLLGE